MGGPLEHPSRPTKPPFMHWRTYLRLLIECRKLEEVEDIAFYAALGSGLVEFSLPDALHPRQLWTEAKAQRRNPKDHALAAVWLAAAARRRERPRSTPLKLSELATRAGVPAGLAREAVRARLLRPDVGRGTRQTRYRARRVNWLRKLAQLREASRTWPEIRAWTRRRWQPEHEHERYWPATVVAR